MIYAYYRVSTDEQDYNSQKVGVAEYCNRLGLVIDKEYIDDGVSGTVLAKDRKLGSLLKRVKKGDIIITGELSRIGRKTIDVLNTCQKLTDKGVEVRFVKQGINLDTTPVGKLMIAIFSAMAEMERDLISQRTKEGLARIKAGGKSLGRKKGSKNKKYKLDSYRDKIEVLLNQGIPKNQIAKKFKTNVVTLKSYLNRWNYGQINGTNTGNTRMARGYFS